MEAEPPRTPVISNGSRVTEVSEVSNFPANSTCTSSTASLLVTSQTKADDPHDFENQPRTVSNVADIVCRNFKRPKVAHCVVGCVRGLNEPLLHETMKHYIVNAFGGDAVVFFALRVEGNGHTAMRPNISAAVKALNPATVRWFPAESAVRPDPCTNRQGPFLDKGQALRAVQQYLLVKQCYGLVKEYEGKNNMKFDWIFRIRTDTAMLHSAKPYCLYKTDCAYSHRHDFLNWIPRQHADTWFNLVEFFYECLTGDKYFNAESMLEFYLKHKNICWINGWFVPALPKRTKRDKGAIYCGDWEQSIDKELCLKAMYDKDEERRRK